MITSSSINSRTGLGVPVGWQKDLTTESKREFSTGEKAQVYEVTPPFNVTHEGTEKSIRVFTLSLNGTTVELSNIGASIQKILLPKPDGSGSDDIVLGYKSPVEMLTSGNPPYFGVIVGRVANRIEKGQLKLDGVEYPLAINNGPNHLHGGNLGFSRRLWDMEIVDIPLGDNKNTIKGVQCTLFSGDGDQGYPGSVLVSATYTLREHGKGVALRLHMNGQLKGDKASPISLAQHSYFNLGGHANPQGNLDHKVSLASPSWYTPTDATAIPTRDVVAVADDPSMDLTTGKLMIESLKLFGTSKAGLTEEEATRPLMVPSRTGSAIAKAGPASPIPGEPYGFDHNYVIPRTSSSVVSSDGLHLVGKVEHEASKRRMTLFTNAPGVQVYSGLFLDGVTPDPSICKEGATYGQWQSLCLETQHFPDSILSEEEVQKFPDFAMGKCPILRPGGPDYEHTVEYLFEPMD